MASVEPMWVSYEEAQKIVGLSRTTLYRACEAGHIKVARVGRSVRLERNSLLAYMQAAASEPIEGKR